MSEAMSREARRAAVDAIWERPGPIIAPSLLAADQGALGAECAAIESIGADWAHLDVMDGRFVPTITFGPAVVAAMRRRFGGLVDTHLMIETPERLVDAFIDAGSDVVTVHVEATQHIDALLTQIRARGARAGAAVNPGTDERTLAYVLDRVDLIVVMTVNPGAGGQRFIDAQLEKIRRLRAMAAGRPIRIQADGGVTVETAGPAAAAGADVLVAGSAVFRHGDLSNPDGYRGAMEALRAAAD